MNKLISILDLYEKEIKVMAIDPDNGYQYVKLADRVIYDVTGVRDLCSQLFASNAPQAVVLRTVRGSNGKIFMAFMNEHFHKTRCEMVQVLGEAVELRKRYDHDAKEAYEYLYWLYKRALKKFRSIINDSVYGNTEYNGFEGTYYGLREFVGEDPYWMYDDDESEPLFSDGEYVDSYLHALGNGGPLPEKPNYKAASPVAQYHGPMISTGDVDTLRSMANDIQNISKKQLSEVELLTILKAYKDDDIPATEAVADPDDLELEFDPMDEVADKVLEEMRAESGTNRGLNPDMSLEEVLEAEEKRVALEEAQKSVDENSEPESEEVPEEEENLEEGVKVINPRFIVADPKEMSAAEVIRARNSGIEQVQSPEESPVTESYSNIDDEEDEPEEVPVVDDEDIPDESEEYHDDGPNRPGLPEDKIIPELVTAKKELLKEISFALIERNLENTVIDTRWQHMPLSSADEYDIELWIHVRAQNTETKEVYDGSDIYLVATDTLKNLGITHYDSGMVMSNQGVDLHILGQTLMEYYNRINGDDPDPDDDGPKDENPEVNDDESSEAYVEESREEAYDESSDDSDAEETPNREEISDNSTEEVEEILKDLEPEIEPEEDEEEVDDSEESSTLPSSEEIIENQEDVEITEALEAVQPDTVEPSEVESWSEALIAFRENLLFEGSPNDEERINTISETLLTDGLNAGKDMQALYKAFVEAMHQYYIKLHEEEGIDIVPFTWIGPSHTSGVNENPNYDKENLFTFHIWQTVHGTGDIDLNDYTKVLTVESERIIKKILPQTVPRVRNDMFSIDVRVASQDTEYEDISAGYERIEALGVTYNELRRAMLLDRVCAALNLRMFYEHHNALIGFTYRIGDYQFKGESESRIVPVFYVYAKDEYGMISLEEYFKNQSDDEEYLAADVIQDQLEHYSSSMKTAASFLSQVYEAPKLAGVRAIITEEDEKSYKFCDLNNPQHTKYIEDQLHTTIGALTDLSYGMIVDLNPEIEISDLQCEPSIAYSVNEENQLCAEIWMKVGGPGLTEPSTVSLIDGVMDLIETATILPSLIVHSMDANGTAQVYFDYTELTPDDDEEDDELEDSDEESEENVVTEDEVEETVDELIEDLIEVATKKKVIPAPAPDDSIPESSHSAFGFTAGKDMPRK